MKFGKAQGDTPKPPATMKSSSGEITAFFGEGTEISGDLRFTQTVRVDGTIRAKIQSEGELVLGPKGLIEGEIMVNSLTVSGRIKGNIRVKTRLEIHPGGRVEGEVLLGRPGLVVHDGGILEAKVQMGTMKAPASIESGDGRRQSGENRPEMKGEKKAAMAAGAV
jgi:cytoskeletal protein CcmA (bactofilin family)